MAYEWRKKNKIEKYEIVHKGALLYAITSEDPDVKANVTNLMITLSEKNAGKFFLFFVEKSEYKGWDNCTLVATAKNGGECRRTWKQEHGIIEIDEIVFDGERRAFVIYDGNWHVVTIYADSPEQAEDMRARLDAREDVKDWEDGNGNSVGTLIAERIRHRLRETLKRKEGE